MKIKISYLLIISYLSFGFITSKEPIITSKSKTGEIQIQELTHYKWFRKGFRKYKPNAEVIDTLKSFTEYELLIYGGDWCSDTYNQLPKMIKVLKTLNFPLRQVKVFFVDEQKKCENCKEYFPEKYKLNLVPVFIILNKENKEIGRITETPIRTLERDLLLILKQNNQ